jgi:hypothetical protein
MFRNLILVCFLFLITFKSFAYNFTTKGFIVLDMMNIEKIQDRDASVEMGYGTADVKFYFNHQDFSSKIKLDIDGEVAENSNTGQSSFDLMEEALVNYRFNKAVKLTFGKGKVRFHQMHHGITERNYTDGGSILGTRHGFRDQDRRYLLTLKTRSSSRGAYHYFTIFGQNREVDRDRDNPAEPDLYKAWDTLTYTNERTFNTRYQRGAAYKVELSPDYENKFSFAGLYYWRDIDPEADWALDLAYHRNTSTHEVWFEAVYAFMSKHPNDKYTALAEYDQLYQLGFLYKLKDNLAAGINLEAALVKTKHHDKDNYPDTGDYAIGQSDYNDGQTGKVNTYKVDIGVQYRPASRVQISSGIVLERQYLWDSGTSRTVRFGEMRYLSARNAFSLNAGLSFWF